jgi:serine/threonine protein kinase
MALRLLRPTLPAIPNYDLLDKLDEGGCSSVYKGRHQASGRTVAIKVIKEKVTKDPALLKRFEQEFLAATKLHHPNIVQALDFYQDGAVAYLVMEFVDGPNLLDRVRRDGPLAEDKAVAIVIQIAQALHYAHAHNIIHRDVKPQNILLKPNGQAKLTDFGMVKDVMSNLQLTNELSLLGTPHFMAPEQYEDARNVDARSDVYALAATLYCAVTGVLPFQADSPMEVIKKQALNELVSPRELVPALSARLDAAILAAMNPDPAQRPGSVLEFVKGLRPQEARPPSRRRHAVAVGKAERRASVRYRCILGTVCATKSSLHDGSEKEDAWPATVQDVSTHGIALTLARRFEPGTVLTMELYNAQASYSSPVEARVVYVKPQGAGHWQVGCAFPEALTEEEIEALL